MCSSEIQKDSQQKGPALLSPMPLRVLFIREVSGKTTICERPIMTLVEWSSVLRLFKRSLAMPDR